MNGKAPLFAPSSWTPPLPPTLPLEADFTIAGICPRVMAFLIDLAFLAGLHGLAFIAAGRLLLFGLQGDPYVFFASAMGAFILLFVMPAITGLLYFAILHSLGGQTLGKLFLGIRVIGSKDGGPVGLGIAFLRTVGYLISLLPFGAGFIWAMLGSRRQAWHDYLAETLVVLA